MNLTHTSLVWNEVNSKRNTSFYSLLYFNLSCWWKLNHIARFVYISKGNIPLNIFRTSEYKKIFLQDYSQITIFTIMTYSSINILWKQLYATIAYALFDLWLCIRNLKRNIMLSEYFQKRKWKLYLKHLSIVISISISIEIHWTMSHPIIYMKEFKRQSVKGDNIFQYISACYFNKYCCVCNNISSLVFQRNVLFLQKKITIHFSINYWF